MRESISKKVVAGAWWNIGWRVVTRSLGFVSLLVLTHILSPSDIGLVAIATSITVVIDSLSQLGVQEALIRLKDASDEMYNTAFTVQVLRSVLTGLVLVGLSAFSTPWVGDDRVKTILLVLALGAVISGFENLGMVRVQREMNFRLQFFLGVTTRLFSFAATILIAYVYRTYWAIIIGGMVARITGVVITYVVFPHRPRFGLSGWRYVLKFSMWTWVAGIAGALWQRSDPFIIGPYIGTAMLGVYMLALEFGLLPVTELIDPVCATLFPGFSKARHEGNPPTSLGLEVATVLVFVTIPFALGISACSGYLVAGVLGHNWDQCQPIIAVLTWACVFLPFSYVCNSALSVEGHVKRMAINNVLASAIKIAALIWARTTHDVMIIAWTAVGIFGAEATLFVVQMFQVGSPQVQNFASSALRSTLATVLTGAVLWLIPGTWATVHYSQAVTLAVGGIIGISTFAIFGALLFLFWIMSGRPTSAESRAIEVFRSHVFGRLFSAES